MPGLPVPESGVALGPVPAGTGSGKSAVHGVQAMRFAFTDAAILTEMLKHEADLRISFGKSMRLMFGDQTMEVQSQLESHRHELYREGSSSGELEFVGLFSHNLEVRELDESAPDESLLNLQKSYAAINDAKQASTTMIVDNSEVPPPISARRYGAPWKKGKQGKRQQFASQARSATTPSMRPSPRSPALDLGEINSNASSNSSSNLNAKLVALRIPIIHLLALGSTSERSLANKTRATEELCRRLLSRIANRVKAGNEWELMDDVFKELDVWEFPYKSKADREKAIINSRAAFSRLRLTKDAQEWQMLLPPDDRGKVDPCPVSPMPSHPAPKAVGQDSALTASPAHNVVEHKKSGEETARSTPQPPAPRKAANDPISRIIKGKGKKAAAAPAKPKGSIGRPPKNPAAKNTKAKAPKQPAVNPNPKIKSAEVIVDSDDDDDVEMEDVKLSPQKPPVTKAASPQVYARQVASKTPSAANSDAEVDEQLLRPKKATLSDPVRKSPTKKPPTSVPLSNASSSSATRSSGYIKAPPPSNKSTVTKEQAGRRSASGSPPKPSPLGSSPPINASDVDNTSAASSPSFSISNIGTSTASQSPLDSLGAGRKLRYIPAPSSSLKRKAVPSSDREDGVLRSNGVHLTSAKRQNSSSPDNNTISLARRFKENHAKYERLYKEAQATVDRYDKKARIHRVLSMHRELESLKHQIAMAAAH